MLEIVVSADKNRNNALSKSILGTECKAGVQFILQLDGVDIGILATKLPPYPCGITAVGILPEFRKKGYGDFFTRAILSRLADLSEVLTIDYVSRYYHRFGFRQCGQQMIIDSKDIQFPHDCCGN